MLRIVALVMILLLSTGVLLPFAGSSAHGLRQNFISKKRSFHHRRHSRAWWRRYRARMARIRLKRRQEAAVMAHRKTVLRPVMPESLTIAVPAKVSIPAPELVMATIPGTVRASAAVPVPMAPRAPAPAAILPKARRTVPTPATAPVPRYISAKASAPVAVTIPAPPASKTVAAPTSRTITTAEPLNSVRVSASVTVPATPAKTVLAGASKPVAATVRSTVPAAASGPQLPTGWNPLGPTKNGEVKYRTETAPGGLNGQASLGVVAMSRPNPIYMPAREERRLLAGVAIADLRRLVIDKMISDGGWVTNDYFRDVAGQRVFIVTAQTPGDGRSPDKSWNFYFTEVNGRIYRLTTNTPQEFSGRMASEAESFIASFHAVSKPANK
jgi:hypothetical protein